MENKAITDTKKLTKKEKSIIDYLKTVECAHIASIYKNSLLSYSSKKYEKTSMFLSVMKKKNMIKSVRRGIFAINNGVD